MLRTYFMGGIGLRTIQMNETPCLSDVLAANDTRFGGCVSRYDILKEPRREFVNVTYIQAEIPFVRPDAIGEQELFAGPNGAYKGYGHFYTLPPPTEDDAYELASKKISALFSND